MTTAEAGAGKAAPDLVCPEAQVLIARRVDALAQVIRRLQQHPLQHRLRTNKRNKGTFTASSRDIARCREQDPPFAAASTTPCKVASTDPRGRGRGTQKQTRAPRAQRR